MEHFWFILIRPAVKPDNGYGWTDVEGSIKDGSLEDFVSDMWWWINIGNAADTKLLVEYES